MLITRLLASFALVMFAHGALAVCPSYTLTIPYQTGAVSANSGNLTDGAGNAWSYSFPAVPPGVSFGVPVTLTPVVCAGGVASPDGIMSTPPSGAALHTVAGDWTWGGAAAGRPAGEYSVLFKGASVNGVGDLMEINHGGQLYVRANPLSWWLWNGTGWVSSLAP